MQKNKTHIEVIEQRTGRNKKQIINPQLREDIDSYIQGMKVSEYLFQSRKGDNKPISRVQAYRVLRKAVDKIGIEMT